jgi:hypothetical protein
MKNLLSCLLLLFSMLSHASTLTTDRGTIVLPDEKGWEVSKDLFGIPFIFFSPEMNGERSNISFTATGVNSDIKLSDLKKDPKGYETIKNNWAKTIGATVTGFHPFKSWKNSEGHAVYQVGVNYKNENASYIEDSYYIDCRSKVYFAKSLRREENQPHAAVFSEMIQKMDCGL